MTATRRTQRERTAEMRARLARAAFEVIRDGGYVNFRTAAVARRAGVSQGAQLHHYPTKNDLTQAAIDYAWARSTDEALERLARFHAGDDALGALIDDSRAFFFSDYFRVALDILMAGGRDEALRDALVASTLRHRQQVEGMWLDLLTRDGYSDDDAADLLTLTLSVVRGFAVRAMVEPETARFDALLERWRALAEGMLRQRDSA